MHTTFDTIIYNAVIVTVNKAFDIFPKGMIGIKNGKIEKIANMPDGIDVPDGVEAIDVAGGIVMPGLVNTHTHMPMTLFRGLADDLLNEPHVAELANAAPAGLDRRERRR